VEMGSYVPSPFSMKYPGKNMKTFKTEFYHELDKGCPDAI